MHPEPFQPVLEVASLLRNFKRPWFIAGGWAIDLFFGRVTRNHDDVDVAIFRGDQRELQAYLSGWDPRGLPSRPSLDPSSVRTLSPIPPPPWLLWTPANPRAWAARSRRTAST